MTGRNLLGWLALAAVAACGGDGEDGTSSEDYRDLPLAADVSIDKVTIYQGVENVLLNQSTRLDGEFPPPVLAGREAALRVYVSPLDDRAIDDEVGVTVVASTSSREHIASATLTVPASWSEGSLGSTAVVRVPAELMGPSTELSASVHALSGGGGGDEADAEWVASDLELQDTSVFRLHIVPFMYSGDGSNRLPETGEARLQEIRDALYAMLPVSDVRIVVEDPEPWGAAVTGRSGWSGLLENLQVIRARAGIDGTVSPNAYFYGLINPTDTLAELCERGCVTGLSSEPENPTDFNSLGSVGVGFGEVVVQSMLHEIGHAHGRRHAPCGDGITQVDAQYPYSGGLIGSWGFDLVSGDLKSPADYADIMGQCEQFWVSDYTFGTLYNWMRAQR